MDSYRDYAGLRRRAQWLTLERVREGADLSVAAYRRELDERIRQDQLELDWKGELAAGVLMGSGAVVARWKRLLAKQSSSGTKSEGKPFGVVSWEEIVAAIEKELGQPWEEPGPVAVTMRGQSQSGSHGGSVGFQKSGLGFLPGG